MSRRLALRDPRSGRVERSLAAADAAELAEIAAALRAAAPAWARRSPTERATLLLAWAAALAAHREPIVAALVADTGRRVESELEFDLILGGLQRWCAAAETLLATPQPRDSSVPGLQYTVVGVPYPLVGVISPWNFPLLLALMDAIPALLAGCTVVVKPSEITPRFIQPLMQSVAAAGLDRALRLVPGDGQTGQALLACVDLICFTGSVATGQAVCEAAARRFIPALLELGGKDPAIVCADADLPRAAAALAWGGMANAGQSCLSLERVYVERACHDEFAGLLAAAVGALELSLDSPSSGQIGPIIAEKQVDVLRRQLDDAFANGARALCGGSIIEHGGLWCEPTVLVDVRADMAVMREESFGPILPLMPFDDDAQALALANDSDYGLSAAVFSGDPARLAALASGVQAGALSLNDCALTAIMHEGEKQSFKRSGMGGSRMGAQSIQRFLRRQAWLSNPAQRWDAWWFHDADGPFAARHPPS